MTLGLGPEQTVLLKGLSVGCRAHGAGKGNGRQLRREKTGSALHLVRLPTLPGRGRGPEPAGSLRSDAGVEEPRRDWQTARGTLGKKQVVPRDAGVTARGVGVLVQKGLKRKLHFRCQLFFPLKSFKMFYSEPQQPESVTGKSR